MINLTNFLINDDNNLDADYNRYGLESEITNSRQSA